MKRKSLWAGVAVLVTGLIFVTGGGAATITTVTLTVNSTADPISPVACTVVNNKSTGTCTLRSAILAADAGIHDNTLFVIKLSAKTYKLSQGTLNVDAAPANTGNIVQIVGKTKTVGKKKHKKTLPASIIDGSGNLKPASVFWINSPTQMYNVVITGGTGNPYDACFSSSAGCGGGVYLASSLDLQNSIVRHNTACSAWTGSACTGTFTYGGGIYMANTGLNELLTLYKTTVTQNVAFRGGGIYNNDSGSEGASAAFIMSSHIDGNVACNAFSSGVCVGDGRGGGLANEGEMVTFDHSTVNGNIAGSRAYNTGEGGGIYQDEDTMQLNHTVVSRNVAGNEGGGIYDDENLDLVNSTVSHNAAGYEGGGIGVEYSFTSKNSTISNNTAGGTFECTTVTKTTCKGTTNTTSGTCATLYPTADKCSSYDGYGGGVFADYEYPQFIATTVTKNLAVSITGDDSNCVSTDNYHGGQGGGVWTGWVMTAIQGSKFTDNTAACGGGIYNVTWNGYTYTAGLANSTISGNTALRDGGGLWTWGPGSVVLYGMTITKNHANRQSGGVWNDQLGSVLLGVGNKVSKNTSKGACKNLTWPCN